LANYKHVYIGPYLRVTRDYKDGPVTERCCTNPKCANHKQSFYDRGTKFCQLCGSQIDEVTKTKRVETVDIWKIADEINEAFTEFTPDKFRDLYAFLIPNHHRDAPREFDLSVQWEEYVIENIDQAGETAWLKTAFAKEIEVYAAKCGANNVEVRWGLFTYSN